MKRRLISLGAALAFAVGGSLAAAAPAQAAPVVTISKVYYNSPGSDTGTNTSLNAEYVRLTNTRSVVVNLKGYYLRDKTGYVYTFTTDYKVAAGNSIIVHTGKGTNSGTHRYWGRSWYVWNNSGDTAYLRNASGSLVDSCTWGSSGSYTNC
ncbi:lamin tail domain-containing protein [Micromonospora mangrovi]|uniref:Lamin tail domain-containing protein n=2 Tax=Micromonospora TaxID=1873 RepID=A0AAU8HC57_9ACTN